MIIYYNIIVIKKVTVNIVDSVNLWLCCSPIHDRFDQGCPVTFLDSTVCFCT